MFFDYGTTTQKAFSPGASDDSRALHRDFFNLAGPSIVVEALTDTQLSLAFPGMSRDEATAALARERQELAAPQAAATRTSLAEQRRRDIADSAAHQLPRTDPRSILATISKVGVVLCLVSFVGVLLAGAVTHFAGITVPSWEGPMVLVAAAVGLLWPFAALWALGAHLSQRAARSRLFAWAAHRPGQFARGLATFPRPPRFAYHLVVGPTKQAWALAVVLGGAALYHLYLSPTANPDDGFQQAVLALCVLYLVAQWGFKPRQTARYEREDGIALAMIPSKEA